MSRLIRRLIPYGVVIVFTVAVLSLSIGFVLSKTCGREFWSNFILNVAAELLGLALAIWIATIVAGKKLDELAPRFVGLVAHLRKTEKIDGPTARSAVICIVAILSEDRILRTRPSLSILTKEEHCGVCLEPAQVEEGKDGFVTCKNCRLQSDVWRNAR